MTASFADSEAVSAWFTHTSRLKKVGLGGEAEAARLATWAAVETWGKPLARTGESLWRVLRPKTVIPYLFLQPTRSAAWWLAD
jgi:hypothetical protein